MQGGATNARAGGLILRKQLGKIHCLEKSSSSSQEASGPVGVAAVAEEEIEEPRVPRGSADREIFQETPLELGDVGFGRDDQVNLPEARSALFDHRLRVLIDPVHRDHDIPGAHVGHRPARG